MENKKSIIIIFLALAILAVCSLNLNQAKAQPDYYNFAVSYSVSDNSTPLAAPAFSYYDYALGYQTVNLTTTPTTYEVTPNTLWSITQAAYSNSSQRWVANASGIGTNALSGAADADSTLDPTFYHQLNVSFAYFTSDNTLLDNQNDLVSYTQFGSTVYLSTNGTGALPLSSDWVDAGTAVTYVSPVTISTGAERYQIASSDNGNNTAISSVSSFNTTATVEYYHQYLVSAKYSTSDGTTPSSSITLSGTQFGSALPTTILGTITPQNVWLDAGTSWSVNNPITFGTQRWDAASGTSGTVTSSMVIAPLYYHQYEQTLSYQVLDGGSPSAPKATGTSLGVAYAPSLTITGTGYWFDASGSITFTTPTVANERWASILSGISATQSNTQVVSLYNQYQVTASYSTSDGSTPSASVTLFGTQYGSSYTLTLTDSSQITWLDASTSWYISNPIPASPTDEMWSATSGTSGTVTEAIIIAPLYYHQYLVTFAVSPSGSGSISPAGINVWENVGSLSITATASNSYSFSFWSSTAGSVASTYSTSTSVTISGPGTITANFVPSALNHFVFKTVGSQVAGTPFAVTITAVDASGNTVTVYSGTPTPTLSYSAGSISPTSATGGFVDGVWTGDVTVTADGSSVTLGVAVGSITGTSNTFAVAPGALNHLTISPLGASIVAGGSETYSAEGFDQYGNELGVVTASYSVNGVSVDRDSVSETLVGTYTVTATYNGVSVSTTLTVTAGPLNYITISPTTATIAAGNSQSYTTTAFDKYGNSLGSVTATYQAFGASVTANSVSASTAGSYMVTATYDNLTSDGAILEVNSGPLSHFVVTVPASATAGGSCSIMVTAVDAYGNTVTNFNGTVSFSVNHGSVTPLASGPFISGVWAGSVTLSSGGSVMITVNGDGYSATSKAISVGLIPSILYVVIIAVAIVAIILITTIVLLKRGSAKKLAISKA